MNDIEFKKILSNLDKFTRTQNRIIKEVLIKVDQHKIVAKSLETPINKIVCFHCKSKDFIRWGYQSDLQRYKCKKCKKTFNSLSGTPLSKLKRKGHWLDYSRCLILGKSIRKSAKTYNISKSTSFRWRHRFLSASRYMDTSHFKGIVEFSDIKEKYSFKGAKEIPDKYKYNRPILTLLFCKDRSNNSKSFIIKDFTEKFLAKKISSLISKDLLFCSNNQEVYHLFAKKFKIRHGFLNLKNKEFVKKEIIHLKNVNKYCEDYDLWKKKFRGVATKYLINYLSWYRTLDEFQYKIKAINILLRAKGVFVRPTLDENIISVPS